MNENQRIVLVLALCAFGATIAFLPYSTKTVFTGSTTAIDYGRGGMQMREVPRTQTFEKGTAYYPIWKQPRSFGGTSHELDVRRMLIEWAAIGVVAAVLFALTGQKAGPQATGPRGA